MRRILCVLAWERFFFFFLLATYVRRIMEGTRDLGVWLWEVGCSGGSFVVCMWVLGGGEDFVIAGMGRGEQWDFFMDFGWYVGLMMILYLSEVSPRKAKLFVACFFISLVSRRAEKATYAVTIKSTQRGQGYHQPSPSFPHSSPSPSPSPSRCPSPPSPSPSSSFVPPYSAAAKPHRPPHPAPPFPFEPSVSRSAPPASLSAVEASQGGWHPTVAFRRAS